MWRERCVCRTVFLFLELGLAFISVVSRRCCRTLISQMLNSPMVSFLSPSTFYLLATRGFMTSKFVGLSLQPDFFLFPRHRPVLALGSMCPLRVPKLEGALTGVNRSTCSPLRLRMTLCVGDRFLSEHLASTARSQTTPHQVSMC